MNGVAKVETAVAAGSAVAAADQIMRGIRDNRENRSGTSHYVKAAVATAIALGAISLLRKEEHLTENNHHTSSSTDKELLHLHHHHHQQHHQHHHHHDEGHTKDLVAEAIGAYALGRQMLGHNDWQILKLVAEGLGAAAFAKEADKDLIED